MAKEAYVATSGRREGAAEPAGFLKFYDGVLNGICWSLLYKMGSL